MRKYEQAREDIVKDLNGQILLDGDKVKMRWAEYFEQALNVEDVREVNINVDDDRQMPEILLLKPAAQALVGKTK